MKFYNGGWLIKEGVTTLHPVHAHEVQPIENGFVALLPARNVERRGNTVDCPALTLEVTSPMADIIHVKAYHYMGYVHNMPVFAKNTEDVKTELKIDEETVTFTSGNLTVKLTRNPYQLSFFDPQGREITNSGSQNLTYITKDDQPYMSDQLHASVGEYFYGLGERFSPYVKNGSSVDIWNADGGTGSDAAYKNIPFYLSNKGYGVLVDHSEKVSFEICSERVSRVEISVPGEELRYAVIYGKTPEKVLERYTAYTGRPALPPAWSFGLWLTTSFTTSYDEETVSSFINGMKDREIPLHVFHFDCFWMREFQWCDFTWDDRVFPNPEAMLKRYKDRGLRICVWINPYIGQRSPLFEEGMQKGYLLKKADGSVWQWDRWQYGQGIVDFTNPEAVAWYTGHLKRLLDMGVDCFKTDFGERIPEDAVYFNKANPQGMHNYYTYLYNKCVFELLEKERGIGEACVFARSATVGGQSFPVHWGGDSTADYDSMAETLRGGLSLAQCGFAFWSHDISGFGATATPDLYKRWVQFGLLSSHSRLHGSSSYRVPWLFDEESCDVLRSFVHLKDQLMPYVYQKAVEAHQSGVPVMRPMMLSFPTDPNCDPLDRQYMLGDALLVAPILNPDSIGQYYLPEGNWTHLLSGEVKTGGKWYEEKYDYFSLPLFVKPNTLLAVGANKERPDYEYVKNICLHLYELSDGYTAETQVPDLQGNCVLQAKVVRKGDSYQFFMNGDWQSASFLLHGIKQAEGENVVCKTVKEGLKVTPSSNNFSLTIR